MANSKMKTWRIKYCGWHFEEIEATTELGARKAFASKFGKGIEIESVEEKVHFIDLFFEAEEKIADLLKDMKHLEIDDCRGDDYTWFMIPVFYCRMTENGPESKVVESFRFSKNGYETEAEMVERFNDELNQFMKKNWKKMDK